MKSNNFKGKVAFVTGAASGIGRATAIIKSTTSAMAPNTYDRF
jgi:NADP-dependent 3-hydroxy acid dehydrogenase YdfG